MTHQSLLGPTEVMIRHDSEGVGDDRRRRRHGKPPKDSTRTFVLVSVGLTLGCGILVPILVGLALTT